MGSFCALLSCIALLGCSSGDDSPSSGDTGTGGDQTTPPTHVVPTDPDSGKNNNSNPDNVTPGDTTNKDDNGDDNGDGTGGGSTGGGDNSGSTDNPGSTDEWKLVFEDNFGDSSETSPTDPNSEYWTLAPKGTDTWNRHMSESYDQAFQQNGYLYLYGELKDGEYLTGGIESRNKFDFEYGQMKCRARFLRQPQGNHTGIWMMPESQDMGKWPRSGEIDVMEHLNDQSVYYSTVHFWNSEDEKDDSSDKEVTLADHNDFNIYGVVWSKEAVSFTLNGEVIFTYNNANPDESSPSYQYPFEAPFYLILSQSLGGEGTWEGPITDSELPAIFQIDWIKVWQK